LELKCHYNSKIHPILNFFNILYYSSTESEKNSTVFPILGQFLVEKGVSENIPYNSNVSSIHYNELIFLCMDIYDSLLIDKIKLITIDKYLSIFGKRINGDIICTLFTIFNLGYILYDDQWYHFNENYHGWRIITDMEILQEMNVNLVCSILKKCNMVNYTIDLTKISQYINIGNISSKSVDRMRSNLFLSGFKNKLDKKPILRFLDCVYDFELKSSRPGRPNDFCSKGTGYCYADVENPKNGLKKVMKFLEDIFVDEELIDYILKILASTLTPGNKLRSLLFFIGNGRNGKTALANILKFALGEYAAIPNVSLFLGKSVSSDKANPHMVELNNAHLAICEEPDGRSVSITGDAKAITGNVGYIKARSLYKDLENIFIDLLPIINTNDKLTINNVDTALMDRIIVIPFTQRFIPKYMGSKREENEKFADILWQGNHSKIFAPAFMKLLLDHYQNDYTNLTPPKKVYDATYEFILRGDHPGRFIKQRLCYTGNEQDKIKLEDVYIIYKKWYKNYVNGGVFHYTTEDLRLDFAKYKVYFEQISNSTSKENKCPQTVDILKGYKFY
jgi:P4 family phage/plasmid primase-like protien